MEPLLIALSIFSIALLFIIKNLMHRVEYAESIILSLDANNEELLKFIKLAQLRAHETEAVINQIDRRGGFKTDDEVGDIFNKITFEVNEFNNFILNNLAEDGKD